MAALVGFRLAQIELTGHVQTADDSAFKALSQPAALSLFGYDTQLARARLRKLPWVRDARLVRRWPDGLRVHIVERRPFAVWDGKRGRYLIDATGAHLQRLRGDVDLGLPLFFGADADKGAGAIHRIVSRHDGLAQKISTFTFVRSRRWRLQLRSGTVIELPPVTPDVALRHLLDQNAWELARDGFVQTVDLRVPGQIILRGVARTRSRMGRSSRRPARDPRRLARARPRTES
ncbi:MAG: FtsQ-type POTRA domain-containing protein [Pseudomonadota bacterium]